MLYTPDDIIQKSKSDVHIKEHLLDKYKSRFHNHKTSISLQS